MATEYRIYDYPGGIAGEDFSATGGLTGAGGTGQYLFVKLSAQDTFVHCNSAHDRPHGISQNNPTNAGQLAVRMLGRSKIVAGLGGLSVGDEVGTDAAGRGVTKGVTQTGANLGDTSMGVCSAPAAQGEIGAVELVGAYRV